MFDAASAAARQAALDRLTLLLNHVLATEPQAMRLLAPHAGRTIDAEAAGWPSFLPAPRSVRWVITRAGLLELAEASVASDGLRARIRMGDLRRWLDALQPGARPPIEIEGASSLAGDFDWILTNVRWDIADDLARLIGDAPAHQLARMASSGVQALRRFVGTARP